MIKRKICIVTSTRAEYGLLRNIIQNVENDSGLECCLAVTGSHLMSAFGNTVQEIENDGVRIHKKIEIQMGGDSPVSMCKTMGIALISFGEYFSRIKPDLVLLLGDRYEICAIACAAANLKIPIAHLYGGETTEGALDEAFRHSITKMSYLHFTSTEAYRRRVIQLGEHPNRVYYVGSTGVENIENIALLTKEALCDSIGIPLGSNYAVGTFHPETLSSQSVSECKNLMEACKAFPDIHFLFTKANADPDGQMINALLQKYADEADNISLVASLGYKRYLSALKYCSFVIGNSSSGIVEAPSFHVPTINIGNRQAGRIQADSIINCTSASEDIIKAIQCAISDEFKEIARKAGNPYSRRNTSQNIVSVIKETLCNEKVDLKKKFYDLDQRFVDEHK